MANAERVMKRGAVAVVGMFLMGMAFAVVLPFLVACSSQGSDPPRMLPGTGWIEGRVVDTAGRGVSNVFVELRGTQFMAYTSSEGTYRFYHVAAGTYEINNQGTTVTVVAEAGTVTRVPDILWDYEATSESCACCEEIEGLTIFDAATGVPCASQYFSGGFGEGQEYFTDLDSVQVGFTTRLYGSVAGLSSGHSVTVRRGSDTVYSGTPQKGRVKTRTFYLCGADSLLVYVDTCLRKSLVLLDSTHLDKPSFLRVTTGRATLRYKSQGNSSSGRFVGIGLDTFEIIDKWFERLDWDIVLVNDALRDTCSRYNRNPQWSGKTQSQSSPQFWGDDIVHPAAGAYREDSTYKGLLYEPDVIQAQELPPGTYSIVVNYADGPVDSVTATACLSLELGPLLRSGLVAKFIQCQSPSPLRKGERWVAGTVRIPEMTFDSREQTVLPPTPPISKRAAGR